MNHSPDLSPDTLRSMPIFGGLSTEALQLIIDNAEVIRIPQDAFFFKENETGKSLYCLLEGSATVEKDWRDSPQELGQLGAGDCIGEMAMIDFQARSASVRANVDCVALEVPGSLLRTLFKEDVGQYAMIMMNMGREVSRRLRDADRRLFELKARLADRQE